MNAVAQKHFRVAEANLYLRLYLLPPEGCGPRMSWYEEHVMDEQRATYHRLAQRR